MDDLIRKHILGILFGVILTGILTGVGMLVANNTKTAVFETQFSHLTSQINVLTKEVQGLKGEVQKSRSSQWTKDEHNIYATEQKLNFQYHKEHLEQKYDKLEERVRILEQNNTKQ